MNKAFNMSKQTTQKTSGNIVPNIIEARNIKRNLASSSIPVNLLNQFSYSNNNSNKGSRSSPPITFDPKDLICSNADDERTLLQKNKRLIQLVLQSSNKIAEIVSLIFY